MAAWRRLDVSFDRPVNSPATSPCTRVSLARLRSSGEKSVSNSESNEKNTDAVKQVRNMIQRAACLKKAISERGRNRAGSRVRRTAAEGERPCGTGKQGKQRERVPRPGDGQAHRLLHNPLGGESNQQ
jgi:hypothetical protein